MMISVKIKNLTLNLLLILFSLLVKQGVSQVNEFCNYEQLAVNFLFDSVLSQNDRLKSYCVYSNEKTYKVKHKTLFLFTDKGLLEKFKSLKDSIMLECSPEFSYAVNEPKVISFKNVPTYCDTLEFEEYEIYEILRVSQVRFIENSALVTIDIRNDKILSGYTLFFLFEDKKLCKPELYDVQIWVE